jgi:hypothetical protein
MTPFKFRTYQTQKGGVLKAARLVGLGKILGKTVRLQESIVEPGDEPYWVVECDIARLDKQVVSPEGETLGTYLVMETQILTDLRHWVPLSPIKTSPDTPRKYRIYDTVVGDDNAYFLLDMDVRDLKFIARTIVEAVDSNG